MNREPYAKLHASQAIEDLLADSRNDSNQQNWLLSYLDVFILIIMLVITLLALTDVTTSTQQNRVNKKISKKQQVNPSKNTSETKPVDLKKVLSKSKPDTRSDKKRKNKELSAVRSEATSSLEITKKTVTAEQKNSDTINIKQEIVEVAPPKPSTHAREKSEAKVSLDLKPKSPSLPEIAEKTVATEQENVESSPPLEIKEESDLNEPNTTESNRQIEKEPLQKQKNAEKNWQDRLKNKLDHLELHKFINVKIKEGYAQIEIQDNVLFDSAKAALTEEGKVLIEKLTTLLKQSTGIIFIEGHTDNQPIATERFPSNWELGSARATSVLHFLTSQGLNSQRLRAVTYADTMPVADNITEVGRRKNRRVNLLVKIPET